jgi:DNA-binding NarL/FixJ family response regulator
MIRAVICDDHPILRRGLRQILSESGEVRVVGEAGNYAELRTCLRDAACEVLLLDIEMPGKNGIEALAPIKEAYPKLAVLILSMYPEDQYAVRALKSGAAGYLHKNSAPEKLVEAVRQVGAGRKFISQEVSQALAEIIAGHGSRPPHETLSDREFQVLRLIAAGRKLSGIAEELALSPKTVSVYRARILEKMHLSNNVELAHYAARHGLV